MNKKYLKKIFFPLKTGRNRFFYKNETASSPLNPMLLNSAKFTVDTCFRLPIKILTCARTTPLTQQWFLTSLSCSAAGISLGLIRGLGAARIPATYHLATPTGTKLQVQLVIVWAVIYKTVLQMG